MTSYNIFECENCNRRLLSEEVNSHKCKTVKEYKIIDSTLWVSDGTNWYPLKLTKKHPDQPKGNRDNNYRGGNSTCLTVLSSYRVIA